MLFHLVSEFRYSVCEFGISDGFALSNNVKKLFFSQDVLEDPRLCCEGHTFCKECILTHLVEHNNHSCPNDRSSLTVVNLRRVLSLHCFLERRRVRCTHWDNNADGCQWTGTLGQLRQHLTQCMFVSVQCANNGCPWQGPRSRITHHNSTCDYGLVPCNECGRQDLRRMDIQSHVRFSCPRTLLTCPLSCQSRIPRLVSKIVLISVIAFVNLYSLQHIFSKGFQ